MKRLAIAVMVAMIIGVSGMMLKSGSVDAVEAPKKVLRHIVLFKFSDEESAKRITEAFVALEDQIDLIKDFEWGTNVSKEGLDKGLTHGFTLTFHSQADLDAYIVHEAHKGFVAGLDGKVADVCVFDYWTPTE